MKQYLKGIGIGSAIGIASGIIGYFGVVFWLVSNDYSSAKEMIEIIRSKQAMYMSMPFTFVCMFMAAYFGGRSPEVKWYWVALGVLLIVGTSIHIGPLKIVTIHMNHLPIIFGSLFGAYIASKLNKAVHGNN